MGLPSLFQDLKSVDEMIENIERNATKKCKHFNWDFCSSMDKANNRAATILFVGTSHKGQFVYYSDKADSISHSLFLLDEFLMSVK
jgi:hypothetical protein